MQNQRKQSKAEEFKAIMEALDHDQLDIDQRIKKGKELRACVTELARHGGVEGCDVEQMQWALRICERMPLGLEPRDGEPEEKEQLWANLEGDIYRSIIQQRNIQFWIRSLMGNKGHCGNYMSERKIKRLLQRGKDRKFDHKIYQAVREEAEDGKPVTNAAKEWYCLCLEHGNLNAEERQVILNHLAYAHLRAYMENGWDSESTIAQAKEWFAHIQEEGLQRSNPCGGFFGETDQEDLVTLLMSGELLERSVEQRALYARKLLDRLSERGLSEEIKLESEPYVNSIGMAAGDAVVKDTDSMALLYLTSGMKGILLWPHDPRDRKQDIGIAKEFLKYLRDVTRVLLQEEQQAKRQLGVFNLLMLMEPWQRETFNDNIMNIYQSRKNRMQSTEIEFLWECVEHAYGQFPAPTRVVAKELPYIEIYYSNGEMRRLDLKKYRDDFFGWTFFEREEIFRKATLDQEKRLVHWTWPDQEYGLDEHTGLYTDTVYLLGEQVSTRDAPGN